MNNFVKTLGIASLVFALENSALAIPKDNVLTVSARDYVASQGKTLADYNMVGVSDCIPAVNDDRFHERNKSAYATTISIHDIPSPKETEVIVDYKLSNSDTGFGTNGYSMSRQIVCYSGTALIPKHKTTQKKKKTLPQAFREKISR